MLVYSDQPSTLGTCAELTGMWQRRIIVSILKEAEAGMSVAELCRKHGISDATFYNWRSKFGGMDASEAELGNVSRACKVMGFSRDTTGRHDGVFK